MAAYRLVLFDFDGTLADSLPWLHGVLGDLADEFGFRRPDAGDLELLRRTAPRDALALLGVPMWKLPFIASRLRRRMGAELHAVRVFEGVEEVLCRLDQAGVTLAVVTSNTRRNVEGVLGGAAGRVAHWACGTSLLGKAAQFRRVLSRSGFSAGEAICIGDEIRDARAARAAGIAFGAVSWGYHAPEALLAEGPAEVFERVGDLCRLLPAGTASAGS